MVATTAAAPETCALYLGSEVWGTGASEGTKLLVRIWGGDSSRMDGGARGVMFAAVLKALGMY